MFWFLKLSLVLNTFFLFGITYGARDYQTCIQPVTVENYRPVCGTDRITYNNLAQLSCADDYKPGLRLAHFGECTVSIVIQSPSKTNVKRAKVVKESNRWVIQRGKKHFGE